MNDRQVVAQTDVSDLMARHAGDRCTTCAQMQASMVSGGAGYTHHYRGDDAVQPDGDRVVDHYARRAWMDGRLLAIAAELGHREQGCDNVLHGPVSPTGQDFECQPQHGLDVLLASAISHDKPDSTCSRSEPALTTLSNFVCRAHVPRRTNATLPVTVEGTWAACAKAGWL